MFDIGFWELLLIAVVALLVLGPERLPSALRSVQRTIKAVRSYGSRVQAELNHELRVNELHEHLKKAESTKLHELSPELQRSLVELQQAADTVQRPYQKGTYQQASEDSPTLKDSSDEDGAASRAEKQPRS